MLMKLTPDDHDGDDNASSNLLLDLHRRGADSIKMIGDCKKVIAIKELSFKL